MQTTLAYRDGKYVPKLEIIIEHDDLAFERGFAVFDYMRERDGVMPFMKNHLLRLQHSQSILNFEQEVVMKEIEEIIFLLQKKNNLHNSYFKTIISARMKNDVISPVITMYQDSYKPYAASLYANGVSLIISEFAKPFPEYKTTFYLGSLREYSRMQASGADDVLFYYDNVIRECSRCNIFIVKNNLIYTPEKNMLAGVTRNHVMLCAREKYIVIEKEITVAELFQADEVFITSTTRDIMPVTRIEDKIIADGKPGIISNDLMNMFSAYCKKM